MKAGQHTKWVLALCAVPLAVVAMLCTIWLLHHGYLSIHHLHQDYWSRHRDRWETKVIMLGLLAPFLAVLFAIVAFFMRDNNQQ